MFTILQKQKTITTFYDFSVESGGIGERERDASQKKEQQESAKFILNQENDLNPNFSEGQKKDIKKIQEMYKNGGLTEHGATDMIIKLLWQGQSLEQQYAPMNKISADMGRARKASQGGELMMSQDQESARNMLAMAFDEKPPKPKEPQPTSVPGEYSSMPTHSTSPIESAPVPSSPSPTPPSIDSNF